MEPTLFGHEDYGDRIVTNKLAYAPRVQSIVVAAGALVLIAVGFFASRAYKRPRSLVLGVLLFVGAATGFGMEFAYGAIGGEPQRFDVVVFQYDTQWGRRENDGSPSQKINYIKRLVGLPGDSIEISGGDIYRFDKKDEKYKIVRKWQVSRDLQEILWYPVAKAWTGDVYKDASKEERARIAVPWNGAADGTPGIKREARSLVLDGSAPVTLEYAYPVSNVYIKQGRWPYVHEGCPEANKPAIKGESGALFRDPTQMSDNITAYASNTWEGIQCPNCKQVMFPAVLHPDKDPKIRPVQRTSANPTMFFYGGDQVDGDLKIDLELNVESSGGSIVMQTGSNLHSAIWAIGGDTPAETATVHPVTKATSSLSPGPHKLSLAYVDATVMAVLDGQEIEPRLIDVEPPAAAANDMVSMAKISFSGVKGSVTRLDLFRDLYYTFMISSGDPHDRKLSDAPMDGDRYRMSYREKRDMSINQLVDENLPVENDSTGRDARPRIRGVRDSMYYAQVPKGFYLMLGDNSPSSSDGRVWGFVPRENLVGRACFIGWPISRWRFIR
jgi:signal peptidase I